MTNRPAEVGAVSGEQFGQKSREHPAALSAGALVARLQELVDKPPTEACDSLEWAVGAYFLGDIEALASLSLRAGN